MADDDDDDDDQNTRTKSFRFSLFLFLRPKISFGKKKKGSGLSVSPRFACCVNRQKRRAKKIVRLVVHRRVVLHTRVKAIITHFLCLYFHTYAVILSLLQILFMSNQRNNNSTQVDDDIQGLQEPLKPRSKNFYRKRPGLKIVFVILLL